MAQNAVSYFKVNEKERTAFGNIIHGINNEFVRIIINPDRSDKLVLEKKQKIGWIYEEIEQNIKDTNPNIQKLESDYSVSQEFLYVSKQKIFNIHAEEEQRKAVWILFQDTNIKLMFSIKYKSTLLDFYRRNSEQFNKCFNTNSDEFLGILNNKIKPNRKRQNKFLKYGAGSDSFYYYAFQFIDIDAIVFAFKFLKETKLLND